MKRSDYGFYLLNGKPVFLWDGPAVLPFCQQRMLAGGTAGGRDALLRE